MRLQKLNKLYKSFIVLTTMLTLLSPMAKGADAKQAVVWSPLSNGGEFEYQSSSQHMAGFWEVQKELTGDFDGDGIDGLVNIYNSGGKAVVETHFSTGDRFEYQSNYQRMAGFWGGKIYFPWHYFIGTWPTPEIPVLF